jgi:ABC-type transport system involved in multi-copper enzyme maturation permease subunit
MKFGSKIDYGALLTGYIGLALVGSMYASIGTFASSITDNQVVAFIIGVFIVLIFFLMGFFLPLVPSSFAGIMVINAQVLNYSSKTGRDERQKKSHKKKYQYNKYTYNKGNNLVISDTTSEGANRCIHRSH